MRCLITNCNHTRSKRGSMYPHNNSWGKYQICPCCSNELINFKTLIDNIVFNACKNLLKEELKPLSKIQDTLFKKKFKSRYSRTWIKYHGPPIPKELI